MQLRSPVKVIEPNNHLSAHAVWPEADDVAEPAGFVEHPQETPRASRRLRWALVLTDISAVSLAWTAASFLRRSSGGRGFITTERIVFLPFVVLITCVCIAGNKLYRARVCAVHAVETATLLRASLLAGLINTVVADKFEYYRLTTLRVVIGQLLAFLFVTTGRAVYRGALSRARRAGRFTRPVVLVGVGDEGRAIYKLLRDEPELGYDVRGVVGNPKEAEEWPYADVSYLGDAMDAVAAVRHVGAVGVIIGASSVPFRQLNDLVRTLLDEGVHVQISGGLVGIASNRLRSNPLGREAAFYLEQVSLSGWQAWVKRALDIIIASIVLIPALPVMAVCALYVRRDGGPIFFRQQRIGRDNQPFAMMKLRTMCVDAEAKLAELMAKNERTGPLFKMADDPRFTRIGKFMDATSLNELPQLFNVLKGDMSLVGPRPALAREVAMFGERLLMRHRVRPGITGLWQVESRDEASFEAYERYDVFYVENWSVRLDLAVLIQTAGSVLRRATALFRRTDPTTDSGANAESRQAA
jgi:exopolysaccharide biosynthesis polyprenyl glycosylphosphotransferase